MSSVALIRIICLIRGSIIPQYPRDLTATGLTVSGVLTIENVSKRFRAGNYGVREVSLELKSGVIGLLGPNGAGKTTLMQMLATVTRPTSGRITFEDVDIVRRPNELRRKLGYLPQDFGVYENLTALEFLTYFAALKGVHAKKRIMEMLETVNLHSVA